METLPKYIQELVLSGVSDVKTGYFFKEVMEDETELPTYTNEKLYATPKELVWGILEKVMEKMNLRFYVLKGMNRMSTLLRRLT